MLKTLNVSIFAASLFFALAGHATAAKPQIEDEAGRLLGAVVEGTAAEIASVGSATSDTLRITKLRLLTVAVAPDRTPLITLKSDVDTVASQICQSRRLAYRSSKTTSEFSGYLQRDYSATIGNGLIAIRRPTSSI